MLKIILPIVAACSVVYLGGAILASRVDWRACGTDEYGRKEAAYCADYVFDTPAQCEAFRLAQDYTDESGCFPE